MNEKGGSSSSAPPLALPRGATGSEEYAGRAFAQLGLCLLRGSAVTSSPPAFPTSRPGLEYCGEPAVSTPGGCTCAPPVLRLELDVGPAGTRRRIWPAGVMIHAPRPPVLSTRLRRWPAPLGLVQARRGDAEALRPAR